MWDPMALVMAEEDLGLAWRAVAHRCRQRTAVAAQLLAGGVHVVEQVVVAEMPDHGGRLEPGQALRAGVPVLDPAAAVDVVDAVSEVVDDRALEPIARGDGGSLIGSAGSGRSNVTDQPFVAGGVQSVTWRMIATSHHRRARACAATPVRAGEATRPDVTVGPIGCGSRGFP